MCRACLPGDEHDVSSSSDNVEWDETSEEENADGHDASDGYTYDYDYDDADESDEDGDNDASAHADAFSRTADATFGWKATAEDNVDSLYDAMSELDKMPLPERAFPNEQGATSDACDADIEDDADESKWVGLTETERVRKRFAIRRARREAALAKAKAAEDAAAQQQNESASTTTSKQPDNEADQERKVPFGVLSVNKKSRKRVRKRVKRQKDVDLDQGPAPHGGQQVAVVLSSVCCCHVRFWWVSTSYIALIVCCSSFCWVLFCFLSCVGAA